MITCALCDRNLLLGEAFGHAEDLEFHPHNDTHLVVANCLAAIEALVDARVPEQRPVQAL